MRTFLLSLLVRPPPLIARAAAEQEVEQGALDARTADLDHHDGVEVGHLRLLVGRQSAEATVQVLLLER